jgi:hypothetical protein
LQALPPALAELLPCEAARDATPYAAESRARDAMAEQFETPPAALLACDAPVCLPLESVPLTLLCSRTVLERASDAQALFLFARAGSIARHGLSLLVRPDAERLLLFAHALMTLENPRHSVAAVDMDALQALVQQLEGLLGPEGRAALSPRLAELRADGEWNPRRAAAQAFELGTRISLCAGGDCLAAFDALLLLRGREPLLCSAEERAALAKSDPNLRALLSFALSETYLEARGKAAS